MAMFQLPVYGPTTVLLFTCTLILIYQALKALFFSPLRKLPGPWYTKLSSIPLKISIISGQRIYFIHGLHRKYGPIVQISPYEVAVSGLEETQKIHKVGSGFIKTEWYAALNESPRDGLFVMRDPKAHAARRKLFARPFSKSSLRAHWEPIVTEKVKLAVDGIKRDLKETGQADLLKWWTFLATDVSGHLMFGESFRMLELGRKTDYILVLEKALMGGAICAELPLFARVLKVLPFKATQQMFNANKFLFDYAGRAVKNARSAGSHASIFSLIMAEAEQGLGTVDDLDVQLEAGNLIVAGSDTTAITLTYLIWAILQRPKLRGALEEEVHSLSDDYTDAQLEALPLLNATIEEALRLYGAAPGSLPRSVPTTGVMIGDYFLPGGTVVSTQSWTLHRNPELFNDPESFDPYRFISDELTDNMSRTATATKSAMFAFGGGSRVCLGIHLAYMELRHGVTQFLRDCPSVELSPVTTEETMKPENYFLIAPQQHECIVVPSKRDHAHGTT